MIITQEHQNYIAKTSIEELKPWALDALPLRWVLHLPFTSLHFCVYDEPMGALLWKCVMFHSQHLLYFVFSFLFYNFYILFHLLYFTCSLLKVQSEGNTYFLTDQEECSWLATFGYLEKMSNTLASHLTTCTFLPPFFEVDLRFSYVFICSTLFLFIFLFFFAFFLLMTDLFCLTHFLTARW